MAHVPKLRNLPKQPSEAEMTDFLSKVGEIENVIKGLNSEDDKKRDQYMAKADELIKKVEKEKKGKNIKDDDDDDHDLPKTRTGFSKTSINKDAYKNDGPPAPNFPEGQMDQKAFMAAMEADALERSERRKKLEKISIGLKEQGNAEFKQGNFQKALEFYDKAIEQIRDSSALYTNRAQAKIKLGLFTEALKDCDLGLKLWPNCLKAYVQQGHAYLGLKDYEKARESYRQLLTYDTRKENVVKDYIAEIDRVELANKEEAKATKLFEDGDHVAKGMVDLLACINSKNQLPMYYAGGFRIITMACKNADAQALFRTNNGLQLPVTHPILQRCLSACPISLSAEERDMVTSALDMLTVACKDNETSQLQLLSQPEFSSWLLAILEAKFKGQGRLLKTSCLALLHEASVTSAGRAAIISKFDVYRLVTALFLLMMKNSTYANTATALMNNIALDKRLRTILRDNIQDTILPAFETLLQSNKITPSIAGHAASIATNLAGDAMIRNKMAARASFWTRISALIKTYSQSKLCNPLEFILGLALNLTTGVNSSTLKEISLDVVAGCCLVILSEDLTSVAVTHSLAILSNIVTQSEAAREYMCQDNQPIKLLEFIKNEDPAYYKPALKCMTTLTQDSGAVRKIVAENKGTSVLMNFLTSDDEVVVGNSALCLSHLCQLEKVCAKLTKTNIIQKLLALARDGRNETVQSNCAILIGKLAQGDSRHLTRLRELHGIEILHGCMKYIK